jgi:hypothetical protein
MRFSFLISLKIVNYHHYRERHPDGKTFSTNFPKTNKPLPPVIPQIQVQQPGLFAGYAHHLRSPRQVQPARYNINVKNPKVRCLWSLFLANRQTLSGRITQ